MALSLATILLLLGGGNLVFGLHFRGGTFKWTYLRDNRVTVTYSFSFNGFRDSSSPLEIENHQVCNIDDLDGADLTTRGYLACGEGCSVHNDAYGYYQYCTDCLDYDPDFLPHQNPDMKWKCTDYNLDGSGYDIGGKTFEVTVGDTRRTSLYYENKAWVKLQNVGLPKNGDNLGWKMITEIDLTKSGAHGLPNSSPQTMPIPVQLVHKNCDYWFEIPVTDPDNDDYRCRKTEDSLNECHRDRAVCGKLGNIYIHENCTIHFSSYGDVGNYAVRLMIEDLDENKQPKSKVSLSFLIQVSPDISTCKGPIIVEPRRSCKTIPVGERNKMTVVAEAAKSDLPVARIDTIKPTGMKTGTTLDDVDGYPLRKSRKLTWTPRGSQVGRHNVGFSAVDNAGFSSGWSSVTLNVVDVPALMPIASDSYPADGEEVDTSTGWRIAFNRPIQRPTQSAYISLVNTEEKRVVGSVDTSDSRQATFGTQDISFDMVIDDFPDETMTYTLVVGVGVAIDDEYGDVNCPFPSLSKKWKVTVEDKGATLGPDLVVTFTPPPVLPPVVECTNGKVDITKPPDAKEGDECFIHVSKSSFTVTSDRNINIPYEVCCPATCEPSY